MTNKQPEIREGIKECVLEIRQHLCNTEFAPPPFDDEPLDPNWMWKFTNQILSYLHSQGVVIKVERELPIITPEKDALLRGEEYRYGVWAGYNLAKNDMKEAGCGFFEPLIEEQNESQ